MPAGFTYHVKILSVHFFAHEYRKVSSCNSPPQWHLHEEPLMLFCNRQEHRLSLMPDFPSSSTVNPCTWCVVKVWPTQRNECYKVWTVLCNHTWHLTTVWAFLLVLPWKADKQMLNAAVSKGCGITRAIGMMALLLLLFQLCSALASIFMSERAFSYTLHTPSPRRWCL